ncbi:DUF421 domain-containing protein [Metabacillus malikii]|uniref:Uncharacterized membrane protein YcaP (DUF421 family) n=1 Tax=Metabacillus malikii TaxID=1504265 RepID=A0ABT9ZDJ5_9BACI|nr:DUF421 domain-containing protein [Metabacillus malikii]MDQ0229325.1 uncharacterized membrane protein YcaP (DUF421 family) [Metabacillus malikii]
MDWNWIWKAILIVIAGTFLLRVAGRKSISQMTLAQTVIMVGIGSLLIQPVAGKNLMTTFVVGATLVSTLVIIEFLQLKNDKIEKFITGKSKVIIENGKINESNMKKMRFTVDQLEMNLRQKSVSKISDVHWATLEPNGQLGIILKEDAQPVTKKELKKLEEKLDFIINTYTMVNVVQSTTIDTPQHKGTLFTEVKNKKHDKEPPTHLQ